eukprot:3850901-Pyramimonas_sp.AAC.1
MGAKILSGVFRRSKPPPFKPTLHPNAAAASEATEWARHVAVLRMGMWTESEVSLVLHVHPLTVCDQGGLRSSSSRGWSSGPCVPVGMA